MAKAEEIGGREAQEHISMQLKDFPSDLLQKFMNGSHFAHRNQEQNEETEEIELSLGLSLNGRFGVDPTRANKITRSSSIPDLMKPFAKDNNDTSFVVPMACASLIRTCSLPTENEDEWRKRKELQTLRRMEAKRKRSEKQRNYKSARNTDDKREEGINGINQLGNCVPFGVQSRVNGGIVVKGVGAVEGGLPPTSLAAAVSQGSNGSSPGNGSSGISEFESQQHQGLNKCSEPMSPSISQSMLKNDHKVPSNPEVVSPEQLGKSIAVESNKKGVKEVVRNVLEDMPCVSTTGDGPNGKRIEGFLYRYRKGEEVRIVCVCHGNFLSPAEFVKHAGGGDVAHPLKHIVVNPYALL